MPQGFQWLRDLGTAATGSALSHSHLKDLAQPMGDALEMDLPRRCFPSRGASPSSCLPQGRLVQGHEAEICFNPKASPTEERESELELYSSPEMGLSPSHGKIQPRRGTGLQLCDFSF